MSLKLETTYRGARLRLEIGATPEARLLINGIVREEVTSDAGEITLKLSSTVQTDYEWHEFIEGIVCYGADGITARLIANNQELAKQTFDAEAS